MTEKNTKENKQTTEDVGKYITDMKELPPQFEKESKKPVKEAPSKKVLPKADTLPEQKRLPENNEVSENPKLEGGKLFTTKDIILGVINLITVVFLIFLITKLPQKSQELKTEKVNELKSQANLGSQIKPLDEEMLSAQKMDEIFLDEDGVVDFVRDVDKLKVPGSAIKQVTFGSQIAIKDKLGIFGLPVIITLEGTWKSISTDLEKIQILPYYFRPVSVNAKYSFDDPSVVVFDYGVILYVNDNYAKTK